MFKRILVIAATLMATLSFMLPVKAHEHGMMKADIVDVAADNGSFNTLVAAVKAAGLVDTLRGKAHLLFLHQRMTLLQNCQTAQSTCS